MLHGAPPRALSRGPHQFCGTIRSLLPFRFSPGAATHILANVARPANSSFLGCASSSAAALCMYSATQLATVGASNGRRLLCTALARALCLSAAAFLNAVVQS